MCTSKSVLISSTRLSASLIYSVTTRIGFEFSVLSLFDY